MPSATLSWLSLPLLSFTQSVGLSTLSSLFSSIFSLLSPFSKCITALFKPPCPLLLPPITFCASVWQLCIISNFLSTTFCLLSVTPLNPNRPVPISGHLSHFPLLSGSLSPFYHDSFILSSSLSYVIQASASHSEIKACACFPSNSKLPTYWKDRQVFIRRV